MREGEVVMQSQHQSLFTLMGSGKGWQLFGVDSHEGQRGRPLRSLLQMPGELALQLAYFASGCKLNFHENLRPLLRSGPHDVVEAIEAAQVWAASKEAPEGLAARYMQVEGVDRCLRRAYLLAGAAMACDWALLAAQEN